MSSLNLSFALLKLSILSLEWVFVISRKIWCLGSHCWTSIGKGLGVGADIFQFRNVKFVDFASLACFDRGRFRQLGIVVVSEKRYCRVLFAIHFNFAWLEVFFKDHFIKSFFSSAKGRTVRPVVSKLWLLALRILRLNRNYFISFFFKNLIIIAWLWDVWVVNLHSRLIITILIILKSR